ncbi:SSU ribosomal protein S4P [Hydrogenispora ethanolica]|uniref:Small ribosomal subunit protein uS4 n=1 Tax=Hydrogenispora ethanolica TaxID=1082276 RepID=A0A4V2QE52_HYDET|nr:30S ribosomal protein S4 [Hydrogenispora ethanolica]TCL66487.1 SSU ribosomal protein S4P [Hydrogenispora ethanolica]
MARYTEAACRLCRREGEKLYLKGDRCYSPKCSVGRRSYAPGQHGQDRKKVSEYGVQLREKQKLRRIYGILERQFAGYFTLAERKKGITGENLLQVLESRLDNVVYRLGLGASRKEARQLVRHGHFQVNGKKVNIPSFLVRPGDILTIKEGSLSSTKIKENLEDAGGRAIPEWLELDKTNFSGKVKALPTREQIDVPVREQLIVEYYSR